MLPSYIIYITVLTSFVGISFYIKNMFHGGQTKPHLISWFFWTLAPFTAFFLQLNAGAGLSSIPVFMAGFMGLLGLIAGLIKRDGYWKITKFDIACGIFALTSLILWVLTRNTNTSIIFSILTDLSAYVPTLIKSWKSPETESSAGYLPGIFNNVLALLIIKNWSFSIYSFSIYLIIINSVTVFFIYRKKIRFWYTG